MSDNELLLAISDIMDKKLDTRLIPIEENIHEMQSDIRHIKTDIVSMKSDIFTLQCDVHDLKLTQENIILPRLDTIESCYTTTYSRYKDYADKMASAFVDIDLLKKVVSEHSEKLQKIS